MSGAAVNYVSISHCSTEPGVNAYTILVAEYDPIQNTSHIAHAVSLTTESDKLVTSDVVFDRNGIGGTGDRGEFCGTSEGF